MKTEEQARQLAQEMVRIGRGAGRRVSALITNMDIPLGYAIGNALEVIEAAEILRGRGASSIDPAVRGSKRADDGSKRAGEHSLLREKGGGGAPGWLCLSEAAGASARAGRG